MCVVFGHMPDHGNFDLEDQRQISVVYHCVRCGVELDNVDRWP